MTVSQQERIDKLEEALHRIVSWSDSYPLAAISGANMRHVIEGVGEIAREALE